MCACSDEEAENGECTQECPVPADTLTTDCTTFYDGETTYSWDAEPGGVEFIYVENALAVFNSTKSSVFGLDCNKIDELEEAVQYKQGIEEAWNEFSGTQTSWVNHEALSQIADSLRVEPDWLHHYTVYAGGRVLWTTKVNDALDCPPEYPLDPNSGLLDCYHPQSGDYEDWLEDELGTNGYAWRRKNWGERVSKVILQLKNYTSGNMKGLYARRRLDQQGIFYDSDSVYQADIDKNTGLVIRRWDGKYFTGMLNGQHTQCEGLNCFCAENLWTSDIDLLTWKNNAYIAPCEYRSRHFYDLSLWEQSQNANCGKDRQAEIKRSRSELWRKSDDIVDFLYNGEIKKPDVFEDIHELSNICYLTKLTGGCHFGPEKLLKGYYTGHSPQYFLCKVNGEFNVLNPQGFIDGLRFACMVHEKATGKGFEYSADSFPKINKPEDLLIVVDYINDAADTVSKISETLLFSRIPKVLVEGFQRDGLESYYPGYKGRNLDLLLSIESDLKRFGNNAAHLKTTLHLVGEIVHSVYLKKDQLDINGKIGELQMMQSIINQTVSSIGQLLNKNPAGLPSVGMSSTLTAEIKAAKDMAAENQEEQVIQEAMT